MFHRTAQHKFCSGMFVSEHQGHAIETATTVMVVRHVSCPNVEPVHCRWPRFPDCLCTSLEHCRRTFGHPALCQLSSVGSRPSSSHKASLTDATARIFVTFVRWPCSFGSCHRNLFLCIIIIIIIIIINMLIRKNSKFLHYTSLLSKKFLLFFKNHTA